MITRFRVQNYKALRDVTVELTPVHVLIGPNDSGKTSLLEALSAFSRSTTERGLTNAFVGNWQGRELVWRGEESAVVLTAELVIGETTAEYSLEIRFHAQGREAQRHDERIVAPLGTDPVELPVHSVASTWLADLDRLQPDLEKRLQEKIELIRQVRDALRGVQFYRWNPRFLALPAAPDSARQFHMDESGFGLALVLDDLLGYDRGRFTALENRFRQVFPDIKSIRLMREMGFRAPVDPAKSIPLLKQSEGKGLHFEFTSTGRVLPAAQVSDGVLLILAYLTVLHLPEPPRLLLVEEPENGIHPKRIEDVLGLLREFVQEQKQTQVVMTTHSPYVVDLFKPEEVTLCQRDASGAVVTHRLSNSKTVREQLDIFTLGEIWTAEGEETIVKSEVATAEARE
jgi:predicted ATPase